MEEILEEYKNNGHFFFEKGMKLSEVSKDVQEAPGVYVIHKLAKGKIKLVYIGKSGTIGQNGKFKAQLLRKRLNNKQDGVARQKYFEEKIEKEDIDALDIYWYVTFDENNQDIPAFVEAQLLQLHYDMYGELPIWNKGF